MKNISPDFHQIFTLRIYITASAWKPVWACEWLYLAKFGVCGGRCLPESSQGCETFPRVQKCLYINSQKWCLGVFSAILRGLECLVGCMARRIIKKPCRREKFYKSLNSVHTPGYLFSFRDSGALSFGCNSGIA